MYGLIYINAKTSKANVQFRDAHVGGKTIENRCNKKTGYWLPLQGVVAGRSSELQPVPSSCPG